MKNVPEYFGSLVFDEETMKARLPEETYRMIKLAIHEGKRLNLEVANVVADAMKDWAIENGATHYTHWFQPLTGITAEKHDSFISPNSNGKVIMEFKGKELVSGESDASSFPSGGLRATFEARGYTAWDPTSYAFIKGTTLCIPTAFCSYGGEALDKKTPLLRSMEALNKQALRVVKLFGNEDVRSVITTVGAEQEYFLIDREVYEKRIDLAFTGRTLFGAKPPKGQELDDHYFGTIKTRVLEYMTELNEELWKLGVLAKTQHNEVAPAQHELAPIYSTTNIACDHNQLTMELMQRIAKKHDMVCLLHEKPFNYVNGSGKHINWALSTDTGINLLEPGETPHENAQFLLFLCAVIRAVDEYQDILRLSVATAGNDHRLGASEAPPAVISIFLGDELSDILRSIEYEDGYDARAKEQMKIGVHVLPKIPKDTTDRNRTSPFAFTGNKFEFRMPGSSISVSGPNVILNTAVADILGKFADELEGVENFNESLHNLIKKTITEHKRIIFNGNGYDDEWLEKAKKRGLLNLPTTPDANKYYLAEKNVSLFERNKVLTEAEIRARHEIHLDVYNKTIHIEAQTMCEMVNKDILPNVSRFALKIAEAAIAKREISSAIKCKYENETVESVSRLTDLVYTNCEELKKFIEKASAISDPEEKSFYYKDYLIPKMENLRKYVDELEVVVGTKYWPYPTYAQMLFSVK